MQVELHLTSVILYIHATTKHLIFKNMLHNLRFISHNMPHI
jgi:hypothetical protein